MTPYPYDTWIDRDMILDWSKLSEDERAYVRKVASAKRIFTRRYIDWETKRHYYLPRLAGEDCSMSKNKVYGGYPSADVAREVGRAIREAARRAVGEGGV